MLLGQLLFVCIAVLPGSFAQETAKVEIELHSASEADAKFNFKRIPPAATDDAGNLAAISLLAGQADRNGSTINALHDGKLPKREDEPTANFFLAGTGEGRVLFNFGRKISLKQTNSYSWHPGSRVDQVYELWIPDQVSSAEEFLQELRKPKLAEHWTKIASVDSRTQSGDRTQVGVSITHSTEPLLAVTQYVIMTIQPTSTLQSSQTFYSEIDFIDGESYPAFQPPIVESIVDDLIIDNKYTIHFDSSEVPALRPWIQNDLMPVCKLWYPRIAAALPSEDFEAPTEFKVVFREGMRGVAYTSGKDVYGAGDWYTKNIDGEATGSIIHELVHVVQQYHQAGGNRPPSWLVEGIADHIRWYQFEPIEKRRRINLNRANYDDAYFASATFLDTIVREIDPDAILKVNQVARQGRYSDDYWMKRYGKTAEQIWAMTKANAAEK